MEHRRLGRTGLEVSVLGLGGVFVSSVGADREEGKRTVRRALELGVNYIDTGRSYADSEQVIGEALADLDPAKRPFVSTKIGGWPQPFDPKNKADLRRSVELSLSNLGLDRVDGLQVHEPDRPALFDWWDDDATASGPAWELLTELQEAGRIGFTGLGGTTAYELAARVATGKFDVVTTTFNYCLLWREAEHSVLPAAAAHDVGVVVGTPFQQGALAVRYDDEVSRASWLSPPRRAQYRQLYAFLDEVGLPLAEIALRWVLTNPQVSTVVAGAKSVAEIEANAAAIEKGPLPRDWMEELNRIGELVPFRPFEEPGGPFGLPFGRDYKGPGPLAGTGVAGGITTEEERTES